MPASHTLRWNDRLRLIFSDVDETVADLYLPAEAAMVDALTRLLDQGIRIVLITGQSVGNVEQRVVMKLPARLRHCVAVGGCSGAELWGYSTTGDRNEVAFDSAEQALSSEQKAAWRDLIQQLIAEFRLVTHATMPIADFSLLHGDAPWHVMLDDRGPQITIEFPHAFQLSPVARARLSQHLGAPIDKPDFRIPVFERARQLLAARHIPVTPRLAGIFALDFAIEGVTKTRAVEAALSPAVLTKLGLEGTTPCADEMEVWGDRFSREAGTDWLMCTPLDRNVRAITFRDENHADFPPGYNINPWNGAHRLHAGLLEFLAERA